MKDLKESCLFWKEPTTDHPKGGITVKVRLFGTTAKREQTLWLDDYSGSMTKCKDAAKRWRDDTKDELKLLKSSGVVPSKSTQGSLTHIRNFKDIMELFKRTPLKRGKNRGKIRTLLREEGRYDRLVDEFGKLPPWQVPAKLREKAAEWLDTLDLEPATVNRHITMAKTAMQIAYESRVGSGEIRKRLIPENYLSNFQLFDENNIRYRILTEIEREKLWKELPEPLKVFYFHALSVPVRKSDLINIGLEMCDQISGCISLPSTKTGKNRTIVMPDWLQRWRNQLPSTATHLHCNLDGTPLGYFSERENKWIMMSHWEEKFRSACIAAGINHVDNETEGKYTFHKTRQEAVMLLYQAGHSKDDIKIIGGWESDDAFKRYFNDELALQIRNKLYNIEEEFKTSFAEELLRKAA